MKRTLLSLFLTFLFLLSGMLLRAQCSICTRTAEQLGEKSASGLNSGIIYLALTPLAILSLIGYRWWKRNGQE